MDTREDLRYFLLLIKQFEWCEFDRETWDSAAKLWAQYKPSAVKNEAEDDDKKNIDADVLIAAQVCKQDAILVTNNIKHFEHFCITFENWSAQTS